MKPASMTVLETHQLCVDVPGKTLCRNLNISVQAGDSWCVLGRNGVGKTTLLHTLAGLRVPAGGSVSLTQTPLSQLSRNTIARKLGILFQDHYDPFPATVMETALIGRHPHLGAWGWEGPEDYQLADTALDVVGLKGFKQRNVATLSGGERRRLGIATLLVQQPIVYLWDEPTNHLDLHHQIQILEHLQDNARKDGTAHIMVIHDLNLAVRFADHFLLLLGGGDYYAGIAGEVLQRELLEQAFGHPLIQVKGATGTAWLPG
ncbi:MAG: ABC transporter ATP-binding protein [Gammaproteobacteria bacterium]